MFGEFQEVGHCGGKITIHIQTDAEGRRSVQQSVEHSSPRPASITAIYALPEGNAVGMIQLGGIGQTWNPPPVQSCVAVFMASDSEGRFGQQCLKCKTYWRAEGFPARWRTTCTNCGYRDSSQNFLTDDQRRYIADYCAEYDKALSGEDGDYVIDMDKVADAVKSDTKPAFYYAEQTQQTRFTCDACDSWNDILGNYGYCSSCGTRCDLQMLTKSFNGYKSTVSDGGNMVACLKSAVSEFDSFVRQYVDQLCCHVPMTKRRLDKFKRMLFHNLSDIATDLKNAFDIDILSGLSSDKIEHCKRMFLRRHVHEHRGGEVDQRYLDESKDSSVKIKQALRETQQDVGRLLDCIIKMAASLHAGFHEIMPPEDMPVRYHQERLARRASR